MRKISSLKAALFSVVTLGCTGEAVHHKHPATPNAEKMAAAGWIREHVASFCGKRGGFGMQKSKGLEIDCFERPGEVPLEPILIDPSLPEHIALSELESRVKDKRIVMFGEKHFFEKGGGNQSKYEEYTYDERIFAGAIPMLKSVGFTHVGVELPQHLQLIVDEYYKDGDKVKLIEGIAANFVSYSAPALVIIAARANGLPTVCFDQHDNRDYSKPFSNHEFNKRERAMFDIIQRILRQEKNRMAIIVGAGHIGYRAAVKADNNDSWVIPPVGQMLYREYGDQYYSADLSGCSREYLHACIENEKDLKSRDK